MSDLKGFWDRVFQIIPILEPPHRRFGREWERNRLESNKTLRSQMKPDDDTRGFMYDETKPLGVIMAVDILKLLEICDGARKGQILDRNRIRSCAKAFKVNNDLHLMATIQIDNEGRIGILEGNHRLELLNQGSQKTILVNIVPGTQLSEKSFAEQLEQIWEKCGAAEASITPQKDVVFCNVDFDGDHFVHTLEKRQQGRYFTVAPTLHG